MHACLPQCRMLPHHWIGILLWPFLLGLLCPLSWAGTFAVGGADGSFEIGLSGLVTVGNVRLVTALGTLRPSQGAQALLLSTAPDTGATLAAATVSAVRLEHVTIPASLTQLRLDWNFLTNELAPSFLNDCFTVRVQTAFDEVLPLTVDTFTPLFPAPVPGYARQSGFHTLIVDVTAYAGTGEEITIELQLADIGDGRGNSAVLLDNLRLTSADEPQACAQSPVTVVAPGTPVFFDGACAPASSGTIVQYRWDFGDGAAAIGRFPTHTYASEGLYQGTLTVTDATGHTSSTPFLVAVGTLAHPPQIVSTPVLQAALRTPYRYAVAVTDPDLTRGDVLTFALLEAPAGLRIDPVTGIVTWTPALDAPRHPQITVQVSDLFGFSDTQTFQIAVGPEVLIAAVDDNGGLYTARSNGDGTFANYRSLGGAGRHTEGIAVADLNADGHFDIVTGQAQYPSITLVYYENQGDHFAAPVTIATLGSSTAPAGDWLFDMAAADVNTDGLMDVMVNSDSTQPWLLLRQGPLTFGEATFLRGNFETSTSPWTTPLCRTSVSRDTTTAQQGSASLHLVATSAASCLGADASFSGWSLEQGPTLRLAYRIPPGTPVGFYLLVINVGWVYVPATATAQGGAYPVVTIPPLLDDNAWHTVPLDLYTLLRERWPQAYGIAAFQWGTNANAPAGAQFWIDEVSVTRRTYVSGFDIRLLPSGGGQGRGLDAADVDGDGRIDLVRGRCCDGQLTLYRGDGTGQFMLTTVAQAGTEPYGVVLADVDGDGKVDLLANSGSSGDARFFKGNGHGTFQAGVLVPALDPNTYAAFGTYDFNGDGSPDVVGVSYATRQVWYALGQGAGVFGTRAVLGSTTAGVLGVAAPAGRVLGQPFGVVALDHDTIAPGETVHFDASGSYGVGTIVNYTWTFADGTTVHGPLASQRFPVEGTFAVLLTVTDNAGRQDRHSVSITVRGTPPVARLACPTGLGEAAAHLGQWPATFDASDSHDDVAIVTYAWDFGDHTTGTGVQPSHNYTALGTYPVTLTVTDGAGQQNTATCTVAVTRGTPPVASTGGPYTVGEAAAHAGTWTVMLDGQGSQDDVAIADYTWTFAESVYTFTGTTINPQEWLVSPGVSQADALIATGAGAWGDRYLFSARSFPRAAQPVFEAQIRPSGSNAGQFAMWGLKHSNTFNWHYASMPHALYFTNGGLFIFEDGVGKASVGTYTPGTLYDVRITLRAQGARYELKPATASTWTVLYESTTSVASLLRVGMTVFAGTFTVDNVQVSTTRTGAVVPATYHAPGTYPVTLRVRDHTLQEATATTAVTVTAGAPPVAQAGGPYAVGPERLVQFFGAASTDDVGIARYRWDFGDGTVRLEANPVHQYVTPGTYTATLTVSDHAGQSATATATVQVGWVRRVDTTGVTVDSRTLLASGTVLVELQNSDVTAFGPFTVRVFADSNGNTRWDLGVDTLLGEVTPPGLGAGATAQLQIPVTGTVAFPGVSLAVFVDTGPAAVSDARAYGVSQQTCHTRPPVGHLTPTLAWQWTGSALFPTSNQVMMTPAVIDLNGDGMPDLVFATFAGGNYSQGVLRAISGQDGHELFTVTDPDTLVNAVAQLAVGDLEGHGRLTIVAVAASADRLLAFAQDGSFLWRSPVIPGSGPYGSVADGGAALADLDGDGTAEIVIGSTVLNANGTIRWSGAYGRGTSYAGPLSAVADLDGDGRPEVVAGNTAYHADGSLYWRNTSVPDGLVAVGNLDDDPAPEIVLVAQSSVYLLRHDGTVKWGPVVLPGGASTLNIGGPPLIADVDGDGKPDIGVAGGFYYTVFERDGRIKWSSPVRDTSSSVTGASVFDFDGDGKMEVIYGDERMLRIYRGTDGAVLWQTPSPSGTVYELPVIVDVDGDGRADLVKVSNNYAFPGSTGIQVYRDATNSWMPTRAVWNQHTYHVTNVNDDGTIPPHEAPSWQLHNTYRRNLPSSGTLLPFPELTASFVRLTQEAGAASLTARLGNGGAFPAPAGIAVAFYDGDPAHGGTLLGRATTTAPLAPGAFTDVRLPAPVATTATVWVVADDPDTVLECREDNNTVDSGLRLRLNQPPVARAGGPYTVAEGTALTLDGTGSSDPDGDALTYTWDLNGDGVFDEATGPTPLVTFPDNGTMTIALRVSDGRLTHTASTAVTVTNVAPVVILPPLPALAVGTGLTATGAFTDPGADTWTATVDYGDGSGAQALALTPTKTFTLTHVYAVPGTYAVTVTVTDDDGGVGQATQPLTVFQPNRAPVAVAGGPYTVAEGTSLMLDGSASHDPDGDPLTYAWDLNGDGVFDDATAATPTVSFPDNGTFTIALQVSDGTMTHTATATLTVTNVAPVVTLGPATTLVVGTPLTRIGTFTDPGAETWTATVDYGDDTGSQPLPLAPDQTLALHHVYTVPGQYVVSVTVTDDDGEVGQATLPVFAFQPNRAPLAAATGPATVPEGILVTLDGSASSDPDGDALTYAWTLLAGPAITLDVTDPVRPTFTTPVVPVGGTTLTLQLTVHDGQLTSAPALLNVTVTNVNHPPVAVAGAAQTVQEGSLVRLDGSGSFDADSEALTYHWEQTSGPPVTVSDASAMQPVFTAPPVGSGGATLTFAVTVSDGTDQATATVAVHVEHVNHPPVAQAGAAQTRDEGTLVTLDGTASSDPDGDSLTWQWIQVSGPGVPLSAPQSATPTFTAPLVGPGGATLVFQLVVSDGQTPSVPAQVRITVRNSNDPPNCAQAQAQPARLWPPNHKLVTVTLGGISDPQQQAVTVIVTGVWQDEPVNGQGDGDTSPDAVVQGGTVLLRAERSGGGNGRVYHVAFSADNGRVDGRCTGTMTVCVPHNTHDTCTDEGPLYDATQP